jgi:hypothetical protein
MKQIARNVTMEGYGILQCLFSLAMRTISCSWGYDRIAGALANLGYEISD